MNVELCENKDWFVTGNLFNINKLLSQCIFNTLTLAFICGARVGSTTPIAIPPNTIDNTIFKVINIF